MVIFSSSDYFEQIYESLTKAGFKIDYLVTECPKPAGRGLKICPNPAHCFAQSVNLPVITDLIDLSHQRPTTGDKRPYDLGLIHAYGQIIPQNIIDKFEHGILNIHPSLLPKYRGASPIITPILNGDKKTGYSIILTDANCDTGAIVAQKEVNISENDTHDTLREKIMTLAISDLPEIIKDYLSVKIKLRQQSEKLATMTSKIKKSDGLISESDNAKIAYNKIRAFSPWPKAYFIIDGKRIIIHAAKLEDNKISLLTVQLEGRNKINFSDFKRGYSGLLTKFPKFVRITEE